jgi:hypothetical protein
MVLKFNPEMSPAGKPAPLPNPTGFGAASSAALVALHLEIFIGGIYHRRASFVRVARLLLH